MWKKAIAIACITFLSMMFVNAILVGKPSIIVIPEESILLTRAAISLLIILISLLTIKFLSKKK